MVLNGVVKSVVEGAVTVHLHSEAIREAIMWPNGIQWTVWSNSKSPPPLVVIQGIAGA